MVENRILKEKKKNPKFKKKTCFFFFFFIILFVIFLITCFIFRISFPFSPYADSAVFLFFIIIIIIIFFFFPSIQPSWLSICFCLNPISRFAATPSHYQPLHPALPIDGRHPYPTLHFQLLRSQTPDEIVPVPCLSHSLAYPSNQSYLSLLLFFFQWFSLKPVPLVRSHRPPALTAAHFSYT